ncbi:PREDICTED: protein FAR-RED ELONGATED HYPOCOTYL 3-like [Erythranthe guttata]|uniref:protein FAR-RED ELONGATED HYPOCOTYL 3-like n=1 Tax=Erythranthe guttata TaxID=4155 RepID=UPI00064E14F5|nr:PREDICTED: protein FAR-RED ELONGATED HYPOCOTYL 3-like [Erythranthe guttata]|eukprot:XP_012833638.1 PREDICTED: protein FAR-RED ELONGATED HYPOCOTYL 3-like [Erythranthe guttata]
MLDGTFLKGKHKGILLSAIGKDGDEGLFPIAFGIVSEETDCNWSWFLNHFRDAVGTDRSLIFVSDRNHGILEGVKQIFPDALHGYCYKHLTRNLQHRFRGVAPNFRDAVLAQFANCAYAVTKEDFARCIQKLRAIGGKKVCNFLDGIPNEKWANAHFEGLRIRMLLMEQLSDRLGDGNRWTTVLTESVDKKMRQLVDKGRTWERKKSSETVYEVLSTPNAIVDLREKVCSCKLWQINGLPCAHAAVVIFLEIGGGYEYIDKWFHRSTFVQSYSGSVVPFVRLDNDSADSDIGPPKYHPSRGRPKRKRIPSNGKFTSRKMRCSRCKEVGNHNKKTCRK